MIKATRYKDLIIELLRKELRVRYKQLALGYVWSIANPLAYAAIYYFVFSIVLKVPTPNYPVFLVASLFPWQWMSNSIMVGPMTFYGNSPLIKKTVFPRFLIPFVVVLQDGIHFVVSLPIVLLVALYFDMSISWRLLYGIPLLLLVHFAIAYSLNLAIASANLFFRDLERILALGITVLFYLTPVLYSETLIPERFQKLLVFHPIAPLTINWRNMLMYGQFDWNLYLSSCIWAALLLIGSHLLYNRLQWRFAEVL